MPKAVLGKTSEFTAGILAGLEPGGKFKFESRFGVAGLAEEIGDELHLIALKSEREGQGCLRNFIAACKEEYKLIFVHAIWNEAVLVPALIRYGFYPSSTFYDGTVSEGMEWRGENANSS